MAQIELGGDPPSLLALPEQIDLKESIVIVLSLIAFVCLMMVFYFCVKGIRDYRFDPLEELRKVYFQNINNNKKTK